MDLEKLEKLHELKEKGILSAEEFEKKKAELLNENKTAQTTTSKKGISWKNVGLSFLFALLYLIIMIGIGSLIAYIADNITDKELEYIGRFANLICGIILAFIAKKLNTSQYEKCAPIWGIIVGMLLVGPLGFWIVTYQFLQIKQGYAVLKTKK